MKLESATFDLDGTLLDTVADLASACNLMLQELGLPQRPEGEIRCFVGKGMLNLVSRCLTFEAVPEESAVLAGIRVFRRHYALENGRRATLYPGVREGLLAWQATGLPLAVVTNKPAEFTGPLLERTGLASFFGVQVGGDTTPHKKPHPEPILFACRQMGSQPVCNVHIGDSRHDIEAARAAGSLVYCVPYGYHGGRPVDRKECDGVVSSLGAALQAVEHLL